MNTANVGLKHSFDKGILDQISTLRTLRLNMAETMLKNLKGTSDALISRGLMLEVNNGELQKELMTRISTLRLRLKQPEVLFADELDMYAELMDATNLDDLNDEEDELDDEA